MVLNITLQTLNQIILLDLRLEMEPQDPTLLLTRNK